MTVASIASLSRSIDCNRLEQAVEHTHLDPPIVSSLGRLIGAELLGQVTPVRARPRHPQQRIEEAPPLAARAALALTTARHERCHLFPLIVPQNLAVHRQPPKVSVESDLPPRGNPQPLNCHDNLSLSSDNGRK